MRVVIDDGFELDWLTADDEKLLRDHSIYFKVYEDENKVAVMPQIIDLEEKGMNDVLSVFDENIDRSITLQWYDYGRWKLL